ncbi:hypothetical protein [Streptomyces sp. NPDC059786]|uniref:hypothetical protein n=1 Tax=Streptomyces sp. NPDC059786 TaxID=3346946 RepID=UPI003666C2D1
MSSTMDRVADLFETPETRALFVDNLPAPYAPYPFSELTHAARNHSDRDAPRGIVVLGREFRRAGIAIQRARAGEQHAGDDVAELVAFTRAGCAWWASTVEHDGPALVATHLIDPCEQYLVNGNPEQRDDAYAALRALATRLGSHSGFQSRWMLDVDDTA